MADNPRIPPAGEDYERKVLGWALEALQEGELLLKTEEGYPRIQDTIDYVMGRFGRGDPRPISSPNVVENRIGKVFLEAVSVQTDIKPFWQYRTQNDLYKQHMNILNKLSQAWWLNRNADLSFANITKFGQVGGTGYGHLVYDTDWQDMRLIPEDPRDVLVVRPSSFDSIQDAFAVIIRRERSVNYLRELYPRKAHLIVADRDASTAAVNESTRAGRVMADIGLRSGFMENLYRSLQKPMSSLRTPVVDEFVLYVKDNSINRSDLWVPIVGNGPNDDAFSYMVGPGEPLYPRGRCIVFTRKSTLRDGPNIYWHGHTQKFPLVKFTIDPMPWSWLGKAPMRDLLPLQEELNKLIQVVAAHNARVKRPGVIADKNALSQAAMSKIDTTRDGLKIRHNPIAGKPVEIIFEPPLDPSIQMTIEDVRKTMDELSGVADIRQLMNLNQIPTTETIEKMLESMTLTTRIRSRVMEVAMREFAMMLASDFLQFYTVPMRVAVLGPREGMTFEDFDYDPGNMIPAASSPSDSRDREIRARDFLRQFKFHISPASLLEASKITTKLMYVQLARAGWCDMWTLGERLDIPEMGPAPMNPMTGQPANTIPERLLVQNMMGLGMAVSPAGRKASGQQMPQMKAGGISESGA